MKKFILVAIGGYLWRRLRRPWAVRTNARQSGPDEQREPARGMH